ncbi:hypothetical protein BVRB_7g174930 [Beta vulgaris subsp. vulgaris]|nr:hypothetical protein BVRB_7g174930 [Beta vulgaris subsp. vulgaris]
MTLSQYQNNKPERGQLEENLCEVGINMISAVHSCI